ncbi:hypothetical protein ABZ135_01430 [Streptomyces sp. NPDC006339]|uniref:hypothetical protein n=1 Tax=Streptomyces sp. NPDC006339 TaxID=3156755 RepID=UPI0033AA4AD0
MNWHFSRSPNAIKMIEGLPFEGQVALFEYIDQLEQDPIAATTAWGEEDEITREGIFGDGLGLISLFVNRETGRITPLQISWVGTH